ncbi:Gfo/Idh/MocA family oxidoreductase [bacterium]|nr:Gfo/Idh/MocA family oxidoreductase [bacterium]
MNTTRRSFIGTTAASALALTTQLKAAEPGSVIKLGVIGTGWYGMVDAKAALKVGGVEISAICDVDSEHLETSAAQLEKLQGKRPQTFKLYQEMLDQAGLDAVIIATPTQWHALQLLAAIGKGLDVYCEKPVSYDIREGRAMVDAVKASDRIVQVGFQRRQSKAYQAVRDLVAAGEIGRVVQADAQIHFNAENNDPTPVEPPASLDWDLLCGPAPKIPYSKQVGHQSWRLEKTTGNGHLVDWGLHNIDATRMMLGLSMPKRVTADGGIYQFKKVITTPDTLTAHFEYDELPVVWRHRLWGAQEFAAQRNNGIYLYGEKGSVFVEESKYTLLRKTGDKAEEQEFKFEGRHGSEHMKDFLDCVRTRRKPFCGIEDAFQSTTAVHLAMIAYETRSVVEWNGVKEEIIGNPDAAKLLKREYRQPWVHPAKNA